MKRITIDKATADSIISTLIEKADMMFENTKELVSDFDDTSDKAGLLKAIKAFQEVLISEGLKEKRGENETDLRKGDEGRA